MREAALKRLCIAISRGSSPTYAEQDHGDALVIGQSCQRPGGSFEPDRGRLHVGPVPSKGRLYGGEVLINSTGTGTLGRSALAAPLPDEQPVFVDTHVTMLRVDPCQTDARFLAYQLGSPTSRLFIEEALSVGATKQRELNVEALRTYRVAVPSLRDQQCVADFLDPECERIRKLLGELEHSRQLVGLLTESRLDELIWDGNSAAAPLRRYAELITSGPRGWSDYEAPDGTTKFVGIGALDRHGLGLRRNALRTLHAPSDAESQRAKTRLGDVLLSITADLGTVGIVGEPEVGAVVSQHVALIRLAPSVSSEWVAYALKAPRTRNLVEASGVGGTKQGLGLADVGSIRVPMPSGADQLALASACRALLDTKSDAQTEIDEVAQALRHYRDALITEAVTDRLDVSKMSDERMEESLHAVREGEAPEVLAS